MTEVTEIAYEQLCDDLALDELPTAEVHAIARLAPPSLVTPPPPIDLAGVLRPSAIEEPPRGRSYEPRSWWTRPIEIPELYAAALRHAACFGGRVRRIDRATHEFGQLVLAGGRHVVDDSFHVRDRSRTLPGDLLERGDAGRHRLRADLGAVTTHPGTGFLVGNAHAHFGHFLLEGLTRLWLLEHLPAQELTFVVYQARTSRWQQTLLEAAGVPPERILCLDEPARFERLLVASRSYNLHRASSEAQDRVWERIGDAFDDGRPSRRVYLSRSRFTKRRALRDEVAVEELFARRGFEVVHPQEIPIGEQIALARSAEHLAGSAGSALYLGAFQRRGAHKLIISPLDFTMSDDHLISVFRGSTTHYFISDATATGDLQGMARLADYTVDMRRLSDAVDTWLAASS